MQYFLALDAGGTKTEAVLADEQFELARVSASSIKRLRTGGEEARKTLEALFEELTESTGISLQSVTRTCIGTSGASVPLVANWLRETISSLVGGELLLCGDEEIALDAAFQGGPGILVVAGTGSNVIGRSRDGKLHKAGGWGPALADEGSGHWIGLESLRSAFRALDEKRPTKLIESAQHHWQLTTLNDLIEKANASPAPDFSSLTPVVAAWAESGDLVALDVLERAGKDLAHLVLLVVKSLLESDASTAPELPEVAFTGSVLGRIVLVRRAMVAALKQVHPVIRVRDEGVDAVSGALWRARGGVAPASFTATWAST